MARKSIRDIDYIPPLIGLTVGVGEGVVQTKITKPHARTYYRAAVGAAGFLADRMTSLHPDITMGMMCSSAALAASSIPYAIHNKTLSGEGGVFPNVARPAMEAPPGYWDNQQRGTSTVAEQPVRRNPTDGGGRQQPVTIAGLARPSSSATMQRPTLAG